MAAGDPPHPSDPRDDYERAACGLLTTAPNGAMLRVNATLCAWTGYAADELLGRRFQDLLTVGSKIFHQTHWMPLLQLQGSVAEVQLELVRRGGGVIAVLVNAARRAPGAGDVEGAVDVAVFVATDRRKYERELLLARRRAEAALDSEREAQEARARAEASLRLALDSARLCVWSADPRTGERRYEPEVAALIGAPGPAAVTAEVYAACVHPGDRAAEARALADALDPARRATVSVEYRLQGLDGVERVVCSTGRAFFDGDGAAVRFSGVLEDVTERRRAQAALRQRAEFAEQLVGIVSHDLRNPLQAVLLGARLLGSVELGAHARTVSRIASSANRANRLISDLLDFTLARLGGGLRVAPRAIAPHALVADCLEEVRLAWPGRTLVHRPVGDDGAVGDPDRLAQVVSNLANNALTYGAADAPVTITTATSAEALEIRVHNAGRPIPQALQEQVFEPMRRGEHEVSLGSRSVGLGLYIVRSVAEAHGGRIQVRSAEGEGTTFTVTLPQPPPRAP